MIDIAFNHAERLLWLPCAAVLPVLYGVAAARRRRDVLAFLGSAHMVDSAGGRLRRARPVLLFLAAASIIVALAEPVWNPHPKHPLRQGRDLVFVLDVSRSMLAADIPPHRLARAKTAIADCVRSFGNQRVGLTIFAGTPVIACPLTLDYDFFGQALEAAGPVRVEQGGTRIEDALLLTCETLFADASRGYRDIVLISDGGDQGESTAEAVRMINDMGVKLIVVGIGSSGTGARVPDPARPGEFMLHRGRAVWTKLETAALRRLAHSCTQGVYLPVGTSNMDLGKIYQDLSRQPSPQQFADTTVTVHSQAFPFLVAFALVMMCAMVWSPGRRRGVAQAGKTVFVVVFLLVSAERMQAGALREAQRAYREGEFGRAAELYGAAVAEQPSGEAWYNLGNARYRQAKFSEAIEAYSAVLASTAPGTVLVRASYNMANAYVRLAEKAEDRTTALRFLNIAVELYRRALRHDSNATDVGVNLELTLLARRDLLEEIARAQEAAMSYERQREQDEDAEGQTPADDEQDATGAFNTRDPDQDEQGIMPPTESPEDILEHQARLRERRAARSPGPRKRVRTDW